VKRICLFNHKGGVSKTTTAFNLGWSMADSGKRVLLVDCDSQCNLSGLILGYDDNYKENMEAFYNNKQNMTMRDIVPSITSAVAPDIFLSTKRESSVYQTKNNNLFLLPGYFDISDLDSQISLSLKISYSVPAVRDIPGNFISLIDKIATRNNIEYIIYDLSPSVGALNSIILMASDYFIVPTSPDYFCLQAVHSLAVNIPKWKKEIERFKDLENLNNNDYPIKNKTCFLGVVQQKYRPRNNNPAKSYQDWIDKIRRAVVDVLVPLLREHDCVVNEDKFKKIIAENPPYDLAYIPDFNSLIAISQSLSKPVFSLTDEEIGRAGKVQQTMEGNRDNFRNIFSKLADDVIKLTL
jgi:cellulose biosynthesis protein BcsQ